MIDPSQVGATIASLRKSSSMTQSELAAKINVTHQAVSKWERGESLPDLDSLVTLSETLQISIDQLIKSPRERAAGSTRSQAKIVLEPIAEIWRQALSRMREHMSRPSYDTWLAHTTAVEENGSIVVLCPNRFVFEWVSNRYESLIRKTLTQMRGDDHFTLLFRSVD